VASSDDEPPESSTPEDGTPEDAADEITDAPATSTVEVGDLVENDEPPVDPPFVVDPDGTLTIVYTRDLDIIDVSTPPPTTTDPAFTTRPYVDQTRRRITYLLIGILAFLTVVGSVGWLLYGDDLDRMQSFAVIFSPVVTLVAAALGFFGRNAE